ncbi:MAG: aromatic acid decarboxylase [Paenibacillus sp. RIFOXYA1_FULL_44_5]|nr:MAG: aromatic acid decarboxylase [Paenibacillus sp. RIFOXYA1_FULL_44_5]
MVKSSAQSWIIGITGASGTVYAIRLIDFLLSHGYFLHLVITDAGWRVLHEELGWPSANREQLLRDKFAQYEGEFQYHPIKDIGASIASGSFRTQGMVVIPCSMGTLSAISHGLADNLLERAADVMLKEGRKLFIVPRETPLHAIHLENMLKLSQMGVRMIPAMPAFYQHPRSLEDMIDFMVGKVLDSMEIEHDLFKRWGDEHHE